MHIVMEVCAPIELRAEVVVLVVFATPASHNKPGMAHDSRRLDPFWPPKISIERQALNVDDNLRHLLHHLRPAVGAVVQGVAVNMTALRTRPTGITYSGIMARPLSALEIIRIQPMSAYLPMFTIHIVFSGDCHVVFTIDNGIVYYLRFEKTTWGTVFINCFR